MSHGDIQSINRIISEVDERMAEIDDDIGRYDMDDASNND